MVKFYALQSSSNALCVARALPLTNLPLFMYPEPKA